MKRRKTTLFSVKTVSIAFFACAVTAAMAVCVMYKLRPEWFIWFGNEHAFSAEISAAARKHQIPEPLVKALIRRESRFRPRARGAHGEIGLMQILPAGAAAEWARVHKCATPSEYELFQVETNLDIGCWFLARALRRWQKYRCGTELALAQYNAGEANANRWKPPEVDGSVIPRITYPGTRDYVSTIMKYYRQELKKKSSALNDGQKKPCGI